MKIVHLFDKTPTLKERIVASRERLYRVAYSWCHDCHLADDLCQETIITALEKVGQLRSEDALNAWLFRILQNAFRKQFRTSKFQVEVDCIEDHMEDEAPAERDIERAEEIMQIRNGLKRLKEGQRMVITLVDIEGFSYKDTAEILDIPIGTVMSRLARARDALCKSVEACQADASRYAQKRSHLKVMK